jgi:hypothetical protein
MLSSRSMIFAPGGRLPTSLLPFRFAAVAAQNPIEISGIFQRISWEELPPQT